MRRIVRDDPLEPDPGFAELYASFPDATDVEPWLGWCRAAAGPVLYLGIGAGRLAVPLAAAGVELVGVDAHPGMLNPLRERLPHAELVLARIEDLDLGRRFALVIGPSGILGDPTRLAAAARHSAHRVALELMNPHWLLTSEHPSVRVLRATHDEADVELEVDYPGGWTHRAAGTLRWPEDTEARLAAAGLELELMKGQDPEAELAESPTYYVLGRVIDLGTGAGCGALAASARTVKAAEIPDATWATTSTQAPIAPNKRRRVARAGVDVPPCLDIEPLPSNVPLAARPAVRRTAQSKAASVSTCSEPARIGLDGSLAAMHPIWRPDPSAPPLRILRMRAVRCSVPDHHLGHLATKSLAAPYPRRLLTGEEAIR